MSARSQRIPKLKQDGSRAGKRGDRRSLARRRGISGPFELQSDAGRTRPEAFREE